MKAWQIVSDGGIDALNLADVATPEPGPGEVRVKIAASSINFRDLMTIKDPKARNLPYPRIPNSDGAGTITAVGPGVTGLKVGDRVASCFFQDWPAGPCSVDVMSSALGGALDGVLAEEAVLKAGGVIPIPEHYSMEQAATLPCAALTAWHALAEVAQVKPGQTVLLLGTGGVSIFALQFAKIMGARVILTSSSDEKLERAKAMGADETVNYRKTPDWQDAVMDLTGGVGADTTVEVGGAGTLPRSIAATRVGGSIGLIGVLTGGEINPALIMRKSLMVQGIYVGSRKMFADMNAAISLHKIEPVIDQTFAFDDAKAAYRAMQAAGHFGKIVITA